MFPQCLYPEVLNFEKSMRCKKKNNKNKPVNL